MPGMARQRQSDEERVRKARERQRALRSRRRHEGVMVTPADGLGSRTYRFPCEVCGEPLRTAGGRRRHMEAIHPGVEIEGVDVARRRQVLETMADEGLEVEET